MRCAICKKESGEVELFEGVRDIEMVMICSDCAQEEGVPLIRKPSETQLERANENYSVRERMERMSGVREATPISEEQAIVQSNMARLKMPAKKEFHENVVDDYYWKLNMARRRKKMSLSQLAQATNLNLEALEQIEKGKIPKGHEEIFLKLESYFGLTFLKIKPQTISFKRTIDEEKAILESVRKRLEKGEYSGEFQDRLEQNEVDFSKREDLENVTLSDLVDRKRKKEKLDRKKEEQSRTNAMMGDDIDLEIEEV